MDFQYNFILHFFFEIKLYFQRSLDYAILKEKEWQLIKPKEEEEEEEEESAAAEGGDSGAAAGGDEEE